ncbi:MAG TPA: hypothetical protein VFY62_15395, partial [Pseudomonas sp.]|nr:hypothetical protein [Pseudomonas sp.]
MSAIHGGHPLCLRLATLNIAQAIFYGLPSTAATRRVFASRRSTSLKAVFYGLPSLAATLR